MDGGPLERVENDATVIVDVAVIVALVVKLTVANCICVTKFDCVTVLGPRTANPITARPIRASVIITR